MSLRFQRLLLILVSLLMILSAILLVLYNARENISYFYTPSEIRIANIDLNENIRMGGFIEKDSLNKISSSSFNFRITDNNNSINVMYSGILPDLFREGQGAVIEGFFKNKETFNATSVFAKHDENYMPSSIKKGIEKSGYWNKKYK